MLRRSAVLVGMVLLLLTAVVAVMVMAKRKLES